jgi:hypothetical protein
MRRRKRIPSLAPKVGDVSPGEYNWREQFSMLDAADGYVALDVGKVRGIVTALANALEALKPLANIPLEEFRHKHPDQPLMGWNNHLLYVRDVYAARNVIAACDEMIP